MVAVKSALDVGGQVDDPLSGRGGVEVIVLDERQPLCDFGSDLNDELVEKEGR